jgi:hypothetical protein
MRAAAMALAIVLWLAMAGGSTPPAFIYQGF